MDFREAVGKVSEGLAAFDDTVAAPEYAPLPGGTYRARVVRGELTTTRAGVDAYKIKFEIADGEHKGKTVSRMWVFSEKAITYARRDLAAFGLTSRDRLLSPFPSVGVEVTCRLVVALQRGDDGLERNDVKRIDCVRSTESPLARFALPSEESEGGAQ